MPSFIPRPNLPEGLAAQIIQMLQVNPYAGAIESLGKSLGGAIETVGKRRFETQKTHGDTVTQLALEGRLAPEVMNQIGQGGVPGVNFTTDDLARMQGARPTGQRMSILPSSAKVHEKEMRGLDLEIKKAQLEAARERAKKGGVGDKSVSRLLQLRSQLLGQSRTAQGDDVALGRVNSQLEALDKSLGDMGFPKPGNLQQALSAAQEDIQSGALTEEQAQEALLKAFPELGTFKKKKGGFLKRLAEMF